MCSSLVTMSVTVMMWASSFVDVVIMTNIDGVPVMD